MRYDADQKQKTHQRVVGEAARAIREFGPDKVGVATLMAQAGLTHGGFYAHFSSKDDLVEQAVDYMFEERVAVLQKAAEAGDPAKGLHDYVDLYLSTGHCRRRDLGCPVVALSGDLARMPASARGRFEKGFQSLSAALSELMRATGLANADALAKTVLIEMVGAVSIARAVADGACAASILEQTKKSVKKKLGL